MRIIAGFPLEEDAVRLRAGLGDPQAWEVVAVHGSDSFLYRLGEAFDAVLVHTGLFYDRYPWEWMEKVRELQPAARIIVALDDTVYDSFSLEAVCRLSVLLGWETVPAVGSGTGERMAELLRGREAERRPSAGGQIVAVWSAASKDGATTIALNTALALASMGDLRVGLIDANLRNPEIRPQLNLTDGGHSHFKLRPKLQTQTLTPGDLLEACTSYRKLQGLHILTGSARRDTALDVTPEMMSGLLQAARSAFDVTLVDLNAYPDNAATICTVREADVRWMVTQNNYASYQTSWNEWFNCYWKYSGLSPEDISLLVNRVGDEDKPERIADTLGMSLAGSIPNVGSGLGLRAVHEGVPLYLRPKAEAFTQEMNRLALVLTGERGEVPAPAARGLFAGRRRAGWAARLTALFG